MIRDLLEQDGDLGLDLVDAGDIKSFRGIFKAVADPIGQHRHTPPIGGKQGAFQHQGVAGKIQGIRNRAQVYGMGIADGKGVPFFHGEQEERFAGAAVLQDQAREQGRP